MIRAHSGLRARIKMLTDTIADTYVTYNRDTQENIILQFGNPNPIFVK